MFKFTDIKTCYNWHKNLQQTKAIVPTMGALHDGHFELVKQAKQLASTVTVSIFVNPSQFGANEDFNQYPRQLDRDLQQLQKLSVDAVFLPQTKQIYPNGVYNNLIVPNNMDQELCGASRPQLFAGAATIVTKLLNCCNSDLLILGEKDYQQLLIIKTIIKDLCLSCKVIGITTKRNQQGLALSSRNQYFTSNQLDIASNIFQQLTQIKHNLAAGKDFNTCKAIAINYLNSLGITTEYLELRDKNTLQITNNHSNARLLIAAWLANVRLIDNIPINLT